MIFENRKNLVLAVSLSTLAGFVDAIGFRALGGFFVSFMSGNSTRFAVDVSQQPSSLLAFIPLGIIVLFTFGVVIGAIVHGKSKRHKEAHVLMLVSFALIIAAAFGSLSLNFTAVIFMALAMGASNNVFTKDGQVSVGVTYMTGTLVKLGQGIAAPFVEGPKKPWLSYLILWLGLVIGAIVGSIGYSLLEMYSLWIAAAFSCILFFILRARDY